jgi:hypothetical protein
MLVLFYYNWKGTRDERDKHEKKMKEHTKNLDGVKLVGMYTPSIPWNRAWLFETDSVDKVLNNPLPSPHFINTDMVILT